MQKVYNWIRVFYKNQSLVFKLQLAMFVVSALSLPILGYYSFIAGKDLIAKKSFEQLEIVTDTKKKAIEDYFKEVEIDIKTLSVNPITIQASKDFSIAFYQEENIDNKVKKLELFYKRDFTPKLKYNSLRKKIDDNFIPRLKSAQTLQYKYIANNSNPEGFKSNLEAANDSSNYDIKHKEYHPFFNSFCKNYSYQDLILIDNKGNVIYSKSKNPDFASNLLSGAFKNSNLSKLYAKIINGRTDRLVHYEDYENYDPLLYRPTCFVAIPILKNNKDKAFVKSNILSVLVLQINNDNITNIITNNKSWEKEGLGISGETNIFGLDYKVRTNTRSVLQDPAKYRSDLKNAGIDLDIVNKIERLETTILLRNRNTKAIVDALNGKSGSDKNIDYLGNEVFFVFRPIDILGTKWAMITEINGDEIYEPVQAFSFGLWVAGSIIFVLIVLLGYFLAISLSKPMKKIQKEITLLSKGIFPKKTKNIYKDELGKIDEAMNTLIDNMQQVADFAENIGNKNYDVDFEAQGKEDILGNSLISMKNNLKKIAEEEGKRSWINQGVTLFSDILRNNSESIEKLMDKFVPEIVKYIDAIQGVGFIYNAQDELLVPISAYAYSRSRYLDKKVRKGEGLVGQAFIEEDKVYLKEIPQNYNHIMSGLGEVPPKSILVIPIKDSKTIQGVLEIASLDFIESFKMELLEIVLGDLATTITSIQASSYLK